MKIENQEQRPDFTSSLNAIELPFITEPPTPCPKFLVQLSCGLFGITDDMIEKYQSLDALFIKNRFNTFFFEAAGDSMQPTIFQGEIVIVDKSKKHFTGKVCVVVYQESLMCKRVIKTNTSFILRSDNSKYKDIIIQDCEELKIWGVVIGRAGFVK